MHKIGKRSYSLTVKSNSVLHFSIMTKHLLENVVIVGGVNCVSRHDSPGELNIREQLFINQDTLIKKNEKCYLITNYLNGHTCVFYV